MRSYVNKHCCYRRYLEAVVVVADCEFEVINNTEISRRFNWTVGSNYYEKVKTFKYLGSLLMNQNYIHEEIKFRLTAGNSCYYSVQTLLSSRLLSNNLKIKIHKTIILPVVLYRCKTRSLTIREECSVLRQIFGSSRRMRMGSGEGSTMRNIIVHTVHLI